MAHSLKRHLVCETAPAYRHCAAWTVDRMKHSIQLVKRVHAKRNLLTASCGLPLKPLGTVRKSTLLSFWPRLYHSIYGLIITYKPDRITRPTATHAMDLPQSHV